MKVTTIRVGKSVEALGEWNKADIEGTIGENEDIDQAYQAARERLDKWLPSVNGGLPKYSMDFGKTIGGNHYGFNEDVTPDQKVEGMKEIIRLSNTKQLLERQKAQIERMNNSELMELYLTKLKTFE